MLTELRIDQFAIIEHLELDLSDGLTTFTGETGAGKSIVLDAITALVGGRTDASMIRSGAERAGVEGVFRPPDAVRAAINAVLEREDLLDEDDPNHLTLSREIRREGRSTARVNGRAVSLALLRELGAYLVDIHGQSEHLSLLNVRQHIRLLDRYADFGPLLSGYRQKYHALLDARRELASLRQTEQDALRRTDLLNYQVNEIETAHVKSGEEVDLRQERSRLANAENLSQLTQQALGALEDGTPDTQSVSDLMGQVVQALASLSRIDTAQTGLSEQAETVAELVSDISRELRAYQEQIEFNPRRLEQIEERLELLHTLKRKYGGSLETVLAYVEDARRQLDRIEHAAEHIAELEIKEQALLKELATDALALSAQRSQYAEELARGVETELNDLSMAGARFAVDLQRSPRPDGLPLADGTRVDFDENGIDRVEFLIAPNPGEGLKPLVKIASGGETSRLMLALKNVLIQADDVSTLIFDEIDQGIGGRVGTVVGEKLWRLGRQHQVLCVTHLPQLAAFGKQHFNVKKAVEGGRTQTLLTRLDEETRLDELAAMIGGLSDANRSAAREALQQARERRAQLEKQSTDVK